jgi:uncharacterized protein (TIGR00369 family)
MAKVSLNDGEVYFTRCGIAKPWFCRSNAAMLNVVVAEDWQFARTAHMKLSPIKEMELAASRIPGMVSLAQGIPSFDTPEPIKLFVQQKIAEGACAKYSLTPGLPQLRELIAESLLREGMHYDPESEIIVTCGSIEGIAATLLDSVMGCAVHSTLKAGVGFTTLEIKVNYVRAMTDKTGPVKAEGKIINVGSRVATAEGRLVDGVGKLLAHGTTTCLIFPI